MPAKKEVTNDAEGAPVVKKTRKPKVCPLIHFDIAVIYVGFLFLSTHLIVDFICGDNSNTVIVTLLLVLNNRSRVPMTSQK
jgi:hypothetical protein